MKYLYLDFEYNDRQVLLAVAQTKETSQAFDLRDNRELPDFKEFLQEHQDHILVSYALNAEITSLLRCGLSVDHWQCIDLMVECRMITMSCSRYFTPDGSLLSQVRVLLGEDIKEDKENKNRMRDLIINQEVWTPEQWDSICLYCYEDVQYLRPLLLRVIEIHQELSHPYTLSQALNRGNYIRKSSEMDWATQGFPVWGDSVEKIYGNKDALKRDIVFNLPFYWRNCFVKKKDGSWGSSVKNLDTLIKARGWYQWQRTENGQPCRQADYLKELKIEIPEIEPYYQAVRALATLNSADLREQIKDGYIKSQTFGFSARTGRNGLKPKRGYLLNLPKWMRRIIRPHPGWVLVGFDWSQQEIAVAAALSNDEKLRSAYLSGDVYLSLAKMAGAVPEDASKKSHPLERELFKALQLGLAYGKGVRSLSRDFAAIMVPQGYSADQAHLRARDIYQWHKTYFSTYWSWIRSEISLSRSRGYISTQDQWVEFVDADTRDTQLMNFPSQSTGAVMMRTAADLFYQSWRCSKTPPVMCSQHDAFYFNIREEDSEVYIPRILDIMKTSSVQTIGLEVRCGYKIYTHLSGYEPEGMQEEHEKLWRLAKEIPNDS